MVHANEYFNDKVKPQLGPKCEYNGPITDAEKSEFLGNAMALLFPIRWREPFGIVMAESLACGTPVIGTRIGSVPEIIRHGKTGFICDSVGDMIKAIHEIGSIERQTCRLEAEQRFSSSSMLFKVLTVYGELLYR
jgi:glycosyltransferase involved in cell wall biosynthesis